MSSSEKNMDVECIYASCSVALSNILFFMDDIIEIYH